MKAPVTDSTLHYATTRYLLRRAGGEGGVLVFADPAKYATWAGASEFALATEELPVAVFKFDPDRWCLVTTRSVYCRSGAHQQRFEAAGLRRIRPHIVAGVTRVDTLDEIRVTLSDKSAHLIKAAPGLIFNLLYATLIRLARTNRKATPVREASP